MTKEFDTLISEMVGVDIEVEMLDSKTFNIWQKDLLLVQNAEIVDKEELMLALRVADDYGIVASIVKDESIEITTKEGHQVKLSRVDQVRPLNINYLALLDESVKVFNLASNGLSKPKSLELLKFLDLKVVIQLKLKGLLEEAEELVGLLNEEGILTK